MRASRPACTHLRARARVTPRPRRCRVARVGAAARAPCAAAPSPSALMPAPASSSSSDSKRPARGLLRLPGGVSSCPVGLVSAAARAVGERLCVAVACGPGCGGPCSPAHLGWCALAYGAVASASPRLDARLLFSCAGWGPQAVDALLLQTAGGGDGPGEEGDGGCVELRESDLLPPPPPAGAQPPQLPMRQQAQQAQQAPAEAVRRGAAAAAAVVAVPPSPPVRDPAAALLARLGLPRPAWLPRLRWPPPPPPPAPWEAELVGPAPPYGAAVVAGTFDRLHAGHRLLLTSAALCTACPGGTLYVGVAGEALLGGKRHARLLQPWAVRATAAARLCEAARPGLRVVAGELTDPLRGFPGQPPVGGLVCSRETAPTARRLNLAKAGARLLAALLRRAPLLPAGLRGRWVASLAARCDGLAPLGLVVVGLVAAAPAPGSAAAGDKLSSTALREEDAAAEAAAAVGNGGGGKVK